jgi:uncharacterized 2Fe-2S/4Fe-4S cluster protein (DUF4445 family)
VAVDLGTTTIVAQLLDLKTGNVLGVRTALNHQARQGADIMSRVDFAMAGGGQGTLQGLVRKQIGEMVAGLFLTSGSTEVSQLTRVVVVGNSVMHHLFCGLDVRPLAHYPFEPEHPGLQTFSPADLGWAAPDVARVYFLPCMGSFVGSDILAGVLATQLHDGEGLNVLIDLGTNGEIVVGNRARMVCASTAAGPAFEGARISMGMRAATGAISEVTASENGLRCRVLGNTEPRGICGSGLVDAVAVSLDFGRILPSGRIAQGSTLALRAPVTLSQADIRELQLAKGAIAAGLRLLLEEFGACPEDVSRVFLAGAFGNYISRASARRIGLLPFAMDQIEPAGNTALLGAKMALFAPDDAALHYREILDRTRHIPLNENEAFHEVFANEMTFPSL